MESNNNNNKVQDIKIDNLHALAMENKDSIKSIKDNHLHHIEKDMSSLQGHLKEIKTDVDWLKRTYWLVAGSSIGGLVTGLFNLIS